MKKVGGMGRRKNAPYVFLRRSKRQRGEQIRITNRRLPFYFRVANQRLAREHGTHVSDSRVCLRRSGGGFLAKGAACRGECGGGKAER
jgi:hypothetical protein